MPSSYIPHIVAALKSAHSHLQLLERQDVDYCHPEILRPGQRRAIHDNQWHLKKTTVTYQAQVDASANVEAAHALALGEGIVIAIIDDAFDIDHPEFAGTGKIIGATKL